MNAVRIVTRLITEESPYSLRKRLSRFLYWQLIRKRIKTPFYFKLPDGGSMNLKKGEHGATGYYYYGYPDYEEMLFLKSILSPGDLFVDIGANSGGWSLTAFGLRASVIAVEPVKSTYDRLCNNFSLNNSNRLKSYRLGISDIEGTLTFTTANDAGNKVISQPSAACQVETVAVTQLDLLLKDESPVVIKIDVEGHELAVVKGATETLRKHSLKALIMETFRWANHCQADLQEIEQILAGYNFLPVQYQKQTGTFRLLKSGEGGQNTIYLKKDYVND